MKSYILAYSRFKKKEPTTVLASMQRGASLISEPMVPHSGEEAGGWGEGGRGEGEPTQAENDGLY